MVLQYKPFEDAYARFYELITGQKRAFSEQRFIELRAAYEENPGLCANPSSPEICENPVNVLQRLVSTLQRAISAFPELGGLPFGRWIENAKTGELPAILGEREAFRWRVALIKNFMELEERGEKDAKKVLSNIVWLDLAERYMRRIGAAVPEYLDIAHGFESEDKKIKVEGINITEQCFGRCSTCSIDALPTGRQMPWWLLERIVKSEDVEFLMETDLSSRLRTYLKDGEPLIYLDAETGRDLLDVIKLLLFERSRKIHITTAGLIPQNRKRGLPVLEGLESLGPYATDIRFALSFNLFFRGVIDLDRYVKDTEEAILLMHRSTGEMPGIIVMYDDNNKAETLKRFGHIRERFGIDGDERIVGSVGRALANGPAGCDEDTGEHCIVVKPFSRTLNSFSVRADGALTTPCQNPGTRGSSIGNVCENDVGQLRRLSGEFVAAFRGMLETRDKTLDVCEAHRRWRRVFKAPRSENPVVKIKRATRTD